MADGRFDEYGTKIKLFNGQGDKNQD